MIEKFAIDTVKSTNLPLDHIAVIGGWCLYRTGLRSSSPDDIDLIADEIAWKETLKQGKPEETNLKSGQVVKLKNGLVEVYDSWAPGEWNTKELIDTADIIDGVRFVNLDLVLRWKKRMTRPKDFEDVQKIEKYLELSKK